MTDRNREMAEAIERAEQDEDLEEKRPYVRPESATCTCTCDSIDELGYTHCPVHVGCDEKCQALQNPITLAEMSAALEHWSSHGYLGGCSHGE